VLSSPSLRDADLFGSAVAISGTRVVVGAYRNDTGALDAGSAYVYDLTSATPTAPVATLNNPNPVANDWFGYSVAIDSTTVVAGTYGDYFYGRAPRAAYIFGLQPALNIVPDRSGFATLSWTP